jgi:hypothetical protein
MYGLHIFKSSLGMADPVALMDQFVAIRYMNSTLYRRVDFLEAYPPFQCIDIGAMAANAVSAKTNITNLDMPNEEFAIFRWWTEDPIQVRLYLPNSTARANLKNMQAVWDYKTPERDPGLVSTEIGVWQDNRPAVEVMNIAGQAISAARIYAIGYRFHSVAILPSEKTCLTPPSGWQGGEFMLLDALKTKVQPSTDIWCSGRAI